MASTYVDKRTGNYVVRAYAGVNPETRQPFLVSEVVPKGASEEEIAAAEARMDAKAAVTKGDTSLMTVGTLLAWHLDNMDAVGKSPTTLSAYRSYKRRHVDPRIGGLRIESARAADFSRFYRDLRRPPAKGGAGLAVQTVEKIHAMLSGCFSRAAGEGLIASNPMAGVHPVRVPPPESRALSPDELGRIVAHLASVLAEPAAAGDPEAIERRAGAVAVWIAAFTGMRRGELAGLTRSSWRRRDRQRAELRVREAVVYAKGRGTVRKEPKSKSSKRSVSLDAETARVVLAWMDLQAQALGALGIGVVPETPLITHADGSPFEPEDVAAAFRAVCRATDMPAWVHLHTLRHTHATTLLEAGANMRTVQERLGHSDVRITLGTYGHVQPGRDGDAADAFYGDAAGFAAVTAVAPGVPACPRTGAPCERFAPPE